MERIPEKIGGFRSLRRWIAAASKRINALGNIQIVRSGTSDSVTVSEKGILINVRRFDRSTAGAGGQGKPGLLIYRANGDQEFLDASAPLDGYDPDNDDNWSLSFAVSSSALVAFSTTAPSGTSAMPAGKERFDGDSSADPVEDQTYYRIPVVRTIGSDKFTFDITGIYRENIVCVGSRGPSVELVKIG